MNESLEAENTVLCDIDNIHDCYHREFMFYPQNQLNKQYLSI